MKIDIREWKEQPRGSKTWKKFKPHFTKAINDDNKSDAGTLKAIGIANAVKEQVDQNKENQRILAQTTMEATEKIDLLQQ